MNPDRRYFVSDIPGFTPHIGRLVSMMNYARETTLHAVKDLSIEQLDFVPTGFGNSIGSLLEHFAAVEVAYQIRTFRGRDLAFYTNQLETVRNTTLEKFQKLDDLWLEQEFEFREGIKANHHWCWFHVFEDEINHRGQIRLIRKNVPK
jgi:uncharacterized damage-inducible protein DinB